MRWFAGVATMATAAILLLPGSASAAPTLTLEPNCYQSVEGKAYGVDILLTGLAPNAPFSGKLEYVYIDPPRNPDGSYSTGGGIGPVTFNADANGEFRFSTAVIGVKTIYTATVVYAGQTITQTLTVRCEPTTKDECKNGGWRDFGTFKNQGDCVSFVATGGKQR
jgi:hypothetical protein